jgi:hypothetical protein
MQFDKCALRMACAGSALFAACEGGSHIFAGEAPNEVALEELEVALKRDLPGCTKQNETQVGYVASEAQLYACVSSKWVAIPGGPPGARGVSGHSGRISTTVLAAGASGCPTGGMKIAVGVDNNDNGQLDVAEVQSTTVLWLT